MNKADDKTIKRKWRKRGNWSPSVIMAEILGQGEQTYYAKKLGYPFKRTRGLWLKNGDYMDLQSEWSAMEKIARQYLKDDKKFFNYANDCLKRGNSLLKLSGPKDVSKLSNKELVDIYQKLFKTCKEFMPFMFSLNFFDIFLTSEFDFLLERFAQECHQSAKEIFNYKNALTFPYKKVYASQERLAFMKIVIAAQKTKAKANSKKVASLIKQHTNKFGWLNMVHFQDYPYDTKFYQNKLKNLLKEDVPSEYLKIIAEEKKLAQKQIQLMKKIKPFRELHSATKAIQILGFVRSFRVDVVWMAFCNHWPVVSEISQRLKLKEILDIKYLSSLEVSQALSGDNNFKQVIKMRKKGFCTLALTREIKIISGTECQKIQTNVHLSRPEKQQEILKGNIAHLGKVSGRCQVIKNIKDIHKVKKGDILVTAMTNPNYIPAMEKAAAFVTDEGGLLCHAAIIAREMHKPCLIGTKIATKVFQDGDIIEVDADKGIVKKL